jgi:hypothetical protein
LPQEVRSEQVSPQEPQSRGLLRLQEEPQPRVTLGEELPVQPVWPPRALAFQLQPPVSAAHPQAL